MEEKLVIIDTDVGTDDAWALFMALAAHRNPDIPFKIVGITCTHGNTTLAHVTVNVRRVLNATGDTDIPVYSGAESALVCSLSVGDHGNWHGVDGFGDVGFPPLNPKLEPTHAVDAIIRLAEQYEGNLSILALGPLTNLALAIRMRPNIKSSLKEIYILGGNYQARGNITVLGEFNFVADAEAAHVVLENYAPSCQIYLCPWETCLLADVPYSFRVETLGRMGTPQVTLMNAAEEKILARSANSNIWATADQIIVAIFIDSAIVKKSQDFHCTVELSGKHSRGMMVTDQRNRNGSPPNCKIIQEVDVQLYQKMLIWAAGGPYYKDDINNQ